MTGEQWMDLLDPGIVILGAHGWKEGVSFSDAYITKQEYDSRIMESTVIIDMAFVRRTSSLWLVQPPK